MASDRIQRHIDRLLDEVDDAMAQLDWEQVRDRAQAVLALDPGNEDAMGFSAAADRALGSSGPPPSPQPPASPHLTTPDTTSGQPTSLANGRYKVQRFLGEGGKKKVYLAHATPLDREVAFALIKTEGLDQTGRSRISREAQAMGRLGSHPHIVTVFDLGEENGHPYMVTELMGGGDVEGLIEDAKDHRLELDQAIGIALETCRGLDFAHGRGIVHRDLKPGNVWLSQDGTAKIGDFGLAVALDRSRLTTEGMMIGTVSYMPPEQAMGGEVTPQSDLYSLGAMLYEMVTGRPPFLGDDSVAIIGQHINTPPVAPTWHNTQCSRPLDALILRLLAKNPSERPESATDVLAALDALDLTECPPLERWDGGDSDPHALDSLAGGVFVGRQREMGELKACLEDALSGRGRLVTLVGEPGIGKSRTAQELATYAGLRGAQVLWGRSYEEQGVPPYWPWVQAIRSYVREREPQQLRSEMGAGAADIAEVVSEVRERLPGLPSAPQLEPEQARFRLFDSIASFLKTASLRQPLVLVLDDLHWADQPSLMLLQFVARELSGARLLLIGTYRDMELSRQHPLAEALGELTRERLFQRVLLRGLTQEDVERFIEMTSGNSAPRGLVEAVHAQTEGNPLFVTEVVRLLVQEGELGAEQVREGESWTIRIPEGVREVIGRRLNRLSQRCNEALTVASILGREFTLAQLRPLVEEVTEDRLFEILEEALTSRVIEELPQSVGRYQFTHALIQETLTSELSLTRRVRLHAQVAEALEELYGSEAEAHAAELAHHFAQAEAAVGPDRLVRYSLLAGERALATYAYEEALTHFNRGLATRGDRVMDLETAQLWHGLGAAQVATLPLHRIGEAVDSLSRAFDYFVDSGLVERAVAVAECPLPPVSGGRTAMVQIVGRALELVPSDSLQAGHLYATHGGLLSTEGASHDMAQEALERGLAIAQRVGDLDLETRSLIGSAEVALYDTRYQDMLEFSRRAILLADRIGDPRAVMLANYWTSLSLIILNDLGSASPNAEASLVPAEQLRHHSYIARAAYVNEMIHRLKGEWEAARKFSDHGLAASPVDPRLLINRVLLEHEAGAFAEGDGYLHRLLSVIDEMQTGPSLEIALGSMVIPLSARITGNHDRSEIAQAAAELVLSSDSSTPLWAEMGRIGAAMLAVQRGDAVKAREHYGALASGDITALSAFIVFDRLLGLLAQTMGEPDYAATHFYDALALCRKAGYRPELAWTCCDYADSLLDPTTGSGRTDPYDRAKAMSLLDESLAISSELGMRPLMERVLSRRAILGA